jgi:hypothetical protein
MQSLPKPGYSARLAYMICIGRVGNPGLAARLGAAAPSVVKASLAFDGAAARHTLHQIQPAAVVAPDVTTEEMGKVYTQRMAKKGAPGREIYDEIFASSPQGRCPLCAHRSVTTLDHHLPKAHYPALAVAPLNLVPACSDCNKAKLDSIPTCAEEVALHPYYDDLGQDLWLVAHVRETGPSALRFTVVAPGAWDVVLVARVTNHFRCLGLGKLYASQAAEELINIRHQLIMISASDELKGVRSELERRAVSCETGRPNGWRAAAYRAWCESDWFCNDGFRAN